MTFAELNARIEALPEDNPEPWSSRPFITREMGRYYRDERLGLSGIFAGQEPPQDVVDIIAEQLFPDP